MTRHLISMQEIQISTREIQGKSKMRLIFQHSILLIFRCKFRLRRILDYIHVISLSANVIISSYVLTLGPAFKRCLQDLNFYGWCDLQIILSCSLNLSYTKYGEIWCASSFGCVRFIDQNRRHRSM